MTQSKDSVYFCSVLNVSFPLRQEYTGFHNATALYTVLHIAFCIQQRYS